MSFCKSTLFIFLLLIASLALQQNTHQLIVPQTFGLMTVTYARGGDNSQFDSYLARYASMDCPIITEINIVWNNQKTPEQMGVFKNSQSWKRPINFYLTPHNSLNWRYKIPKESKARVYFSIDDDIVVDCSELTKGFKTWQANAIGQIGPIVSYNSRYFEYTNGKGFKYGINPQQFYTIGLMGVAFVSRHFLELYYADIWQLEEMRKIVINKNNCEDLGLDFLAQFFYPQLQTMAIGGRVSNLMPRIGVSSDPNHMKKRSECISQYTFIFGINVFRYRPITDKYPNIQTWSFPFRNESILAKKEYLQREVLHKQDIKQKVSSQLISESILISQPVLISESTLIPGSVILCAELSLMSLVIFLLIWKIKGKISRKLSNSRVLTISMSESVSLKTASSSYETNNPQ